MLRRDKRTVEGLRGNRKKRGGGQMEMAVSGVNYQYDVQ